MEEVLNALRVMMNIPDLDEEIFCKLNPHFLTDFC